MLFVGTILAPGGLTVSSALRAMGLNQEKRFHRYRRVLGCASWSSREVDRVLLHTEGQLDELRAVDWAVARLVRALQESGQLENTLIVYCTDNGFMLGEHGLMDKAAPYKRRRSRVTPSRQYFPYL